MSHTDIKHESWISKLPDSVQPYAVLMRLDRPIGIWLLLIPGWWGIFMATRGIEGMFGYDWFIFALFFFGAIIMRSAGCIINDIWDRKLDASVERTKGRPLASGALKLWQAAALLFFLLFTGLIILMMLPGTAIGLGFLSMLFVAVYPYMKRITWWPQLFLGLTFNFGALMGYAAILDTLSLPVFLLYASCIFWTLGYDTIYAHQDKEDDVLVGIKSTALLFGARSKLMVTACYFLSFMLLVLAISLEGTKPLVISFLTFGWIHMVWQIYKWDPDDALNSLLIFKSNRDYGLIVLFVLALNSF